MITGKMTHLGWTLHSLEATSSMSTQRLIGTTQEKNKAHSKSRKKQQMIERSLVTTESTRILKYPHQLGHTKYTKLKNTPHNIFGFLLFQTITFVTLIHTQSTPITYQQKKNNGAYLNKSLNPLLQED